MMLEMDLATILQPLKMPEVSGWLRPRAWGRNVSLRGKIFPDRLVRDRIY
jgi:hypothetical protein